MVQVQFSKLWQEAGFPVLKSNGINFVGKDGFNKSKTDIRTNDLQGREGRRNCCYINFLLLIFSCWYFVKKLFSLICKCLQLLEYKEDFGFFVFLLQWTCPLCTKLNDPRDISVNHSACTENEVFVHEVYVHILYFKHTASSSDCHINLFAW